MMPNMRLVRQWEKYPIRTCYTLHHCKWCGLDITMGQRYRDGGYSRRCHLECAPGYLIKREEERDV